MNRTYVRRGPRLAETAGSTRTVYVSREDRDTWNRAVEFCQEQDIPLSRIIADALAWYLDRVTTETEPAA